MNFNIVLSGVARRMVAMSSHARAQDYILIGAPPGAAGEMLTIASRISPFGTMLGTLTVAGER